MKRLIHYLLGAVLAAALVLGASACGDERVPLDLKPDPNVFRVLLTNPHYGQFNVPLTSPVLIYTSHELDPSSVAGRVLLTDPQGVQADVATEVYNQSVILTPNSNWEERTAYTLRLLPGLRAKTGQMLKEEKVYTFESGLRRPKAAERLSVRRVTPAADEPCWDFMTFRVYFNEPVDRDKLLYGESVKFEDVETGELLPGNLFARAGQLVFDPDQDLVGGKTYRMTITDKLTDVQGSSLAEPYVVEWKAVSTGEHKILAMEKCPTTAIIR
jgi:hypothetical protein